MTFPTSSLISRRRLLAATAAAAAALALPPWAYAEPSAEDAAAFIRGLADRALEIVQRPEIDTSEARRQLRVVLQDATDLDVVGKLVLGRHWRTANDAQRREYQELFRQFVMQNTADQFESYSGESYALTEANVVSERDAQVTTVLNRPNAPPLSIVWRVRQQNGGYAIIDVIVEGVSLVITQRDEFNAVVSRAGIDGLLDELRSRVG